MLNDMNAFKLYPNVKKINGKLVSNEDGGTLGDIDILVITKDEAFWKSQKKNAFKYKDCTVAPRTEKGYKLFTKSGSFIGYSLDYKPIMKGGHRHNHIYNVCNRITFRGKKTRRVKPADKKYFVSIFWDNIALMPDELNKILANKRKTK